MNINLEDFQRPLKFRVWNLKDKSWDNPAMLEVWDASGKLEPSSYIKTGGLNPIYQPIENYIIQQYTGLKDRNNKDIFEGDILASRVHEKPCNYIVKWSSHRNNYCGFALNPVMKDPPRVTFHIHDFSCWMAEGFEVIGNIFDNPELLTLPPKELPPLPPYVDKGPQGACINGCGSEACDDGKCSSCGGVCE
jgi:uncharacterized phage protein (TIGR01671 family)